ncbi:MAG: hypothetical protein OXC63_05870 [Aestuariivita sp.]|nr:hypothetical protein [Aestuariivita sp.]MCY4346332.1 hypothetical protein [Aestuariivita sp.]
MNVAQLKPRWQKPACRREAKDRLPDDAVFVLWEKLTDRPATELQFGPRETLLVTKIRHKLGIASPVPDQWPQNIAPWSNEQLDAATPEAVSLVRRIYEWWLRLFAHPRTRLETLAWHRQQWYHSRWRWRLHALRRTLRGAPTGILPVNRR